MVYFKFVSEITDIGLRISFKIQVLKFELVMLGRKWGGKKYPK